MAFARTRSVICISLGYLLSSVCAAQAQPRKVILDVSVQRVADGEVTPVPDVALIWDDRRNRKAGLEPRHIAPPAEPHRLTIERGALRPRVSSMRAGQTLEIVSSSDDHNPHVSYVFNGVRGFRPRLEPPLVYQRMIDRVEPAPLPIRCNFHDDEEAWVIVKDHGHVGITGADGTLMITDLHPGENCFQLWHPEISSSPPKLSIDGAPLVLDRGRLNLSLTEGMNQFVIQIEGDSISSLDLSDYEEAISGTGHAIAMVAVPGGEFWVRTYLPNERSIEAERQDAVIIAPFWIGKYEIRYGEFTAWSNDRLTGAVPASVKESKRPIHPEASTYSGFWNEAGKRTNEWPAVGMTHWSAKRYCHWLSMMTGRFYRLPTEAEWEFACRGGSVAGSYPWGDDFATIDDYAVRATGGDCENCIAKTGSKQPNGYGIYDMIGNAEEWVADGFDPLRSYQGSDRLMIWPVSDSFIQDTTDLKQRLRELHEPAGGWGVAKGGSCCRFRCQDPRCFQVAARMDPYLLFNQANPAVPHQDQVDTLPPARGVEATIGFRVARPAHVPSRERQLWQWGIYSNHPDWWQHTLRPTD